MLSIRVITSLSKQNRHFSGFLRTTSTLAVKTKDANASGLCFDLSPEQQELRNLARRLARNELLPRAKELDRTGQFPADFIKRLQELGLNHVGIPAEYGGAGLGVLHEALVIEELAYCCPAFTGICGASAILLHALLRFGSEQLKKRVFSELVAHPNPLTAACVTESGAGSDVAKVQLRATRKGDQYVLNGTKMWITNAAFAEWYLVLARSHEDPHAPANVAFTAFLVPRGTAGLSFGKKENMMGQRCSSTRAVIFEDVCVPKEQVLGHEGGGFRIVMTGFDCSRPLIASGAVGLAQRALDESARYAVERKSFGRPIAEHQAVAFILADMAIGVEAARTLVHRSADSVDRHVHNASLHSSIAKAFATELACKSATDAVQIFGGMGYCADSPVEVLFRDSKILTLYEGTSQIQRMVISRRLLGHR